MTHVECLEIGDYIALVECYCDQRTVTAFGPLWLEATDVSFPGLPLQVRAISLPFICVELRGQRFAIDCREWGFQKLNKRYAKEMLAGNGAVKQAAECRRPGDGNCPHCGSRLRHRLTEGQRAFRIVCPECGWDGGEVPTKAMDV